MGALVPLFALGIPGSATTAVMLGAFILHGIQPGPLMFQNQADLLYTVFIGLIIANVSILFLSRPFIRIFAKVLFLPYSIVGPLIILFCIVGTYAVRNSVFDIALMLAFGVLGYYLEKVKFPLAPIILGIVLGPIAEVQFRRAMEMSNGDITIFFTRPLSLVMIILGVISFIYPLVKNWRMKQKDERTGAKTAS